MTCEQSYYSFTQDKPDNGYYGYHAHYAHYLMIGRRRRKGEEVENRLIDLLASPQVKMLQLG